MNFEMIASGLVAGLFFGMLSFSELGRRVGIVQLARNPKGLAKGPAQPMLPYSAYWG